MEVKRDIETLDDIKRMVDGFYQQVRADGLLGPVFHQIIGEDWSVHLEKMYRFWQSVLLGGQTYQGNPFQAHIKLNINRMHFVRWLVLFNQNIDDNFLGANANDAKTRAMQMAEIFTYRLEQLRQEV